MKSAFSIIKLISASIAIAFGLLLATSSAQIAFITPATGWLTAILGVLIASSKSRGMRIVGFGVIAAGFYMGLRAADIIRFPYIRVAAGAGLVLIGAITIYQIYQASRQS